MWLMLEIVWTGLEQTFCQLSLGEDAGTARSGVRGTCYPLQTRRSNKLTLDTSAAQILAINRAPESICLGNCAIVLQTVTIVSMKP